MTTAQIPRASTRHQDYAYAAAIKSIDAIRDFRIKDAAHGLEARIVIATQDEPSNTSLMLANGKSKPDTNLYELMTRRKQCFWASSAHGLASSRRGLE